MPEVTVRYYDGVGDGVETTWDQARADLIVEGLPVRTPPSYRGQGSYPGLFWAATNDRMLVYESLLELDRLWLADFDPTVTGIASQPFQVVGLNAGIRRSHVPDVLLVHSDGAVTVVDVKAERFLSKPQVQAQFAWTRRLCRAKGWTYEVFTGADATVLCNIKTLALGRRPDRLPAGLLASARASLTEDVTTLSDLLAHQPVASESTGWRAAAMALVWSGVIEVDLTRPVSGATKISGREMEAV